MLCTGMLLRIRVGQPFRREPIHGIHRDAVAVRVDQLVIDPVAAALRQLVHVQFARGKHHLARGAVDLIAIDVDVRKVVVGANLLNLPQCILQRVPVPQADVLQRRLIVGRIGCIDGGLRRKLVLHKSVQAKRLPRHLDVVGNVGPLAHQLIRLHHKVADVPTHNADHAITEYRRHDGRDQPAPARRPDAAGSGNQSRPAQAPCRWPASRQASHARRCN